MSKKIKFNWKVPLSWILAFCVSFIFVRVVVMSLGGKMTYDIFTFLLIPICIGSIPFYIIIKKNILK